MQGNSLKMFFKQWIVATLVDILIPYLVKFSECQLNCGTLSRSTCTDANTTNWNKDSIGENLKEWILSISKIRSLTKNEKETFFLRKTILQLETAGKKVEGTSSPIQYIANRDCTQNIHIGPTWRKGSVVSGTQFHDGFLYGLEDGDRELTGW